MRSAFLCEVLPLYAKSAHLHIALDTCGAIAWEDYARVLDWVDLVSCFAKNHEQRVPQALDRHLK